MLQSQRASCIRERRSGQRCGEIDPSAGQAQGQCGSSSSGFCWNATLYFYLKNKNNPAFSCIYFIPLLSSKPLFSSAKIPSLRTLRRSSTACLDTFKVHRANISNYPNRSNHTPSCPKLDCFFSSSNQFPVHKLQTNPAPALEFDAKPHIDILHLYIPLSLRTASRLFSSQE